MPGHARTRHHPFFAFSQLNYTGRPIIILIVHQSLFHRVLAAVLFLAAALNLSAQGNAISYQGRLNVSGTPANTNYDFRFAVFDAPTNGNLISLWVTNSAVPVSNGLFSVTLNFGPGVFNGTDNGSNDWMDIAVRAVGAGSFTPLVPRQPILPVPYALYATTAGNLLGGLQATQIVGNLSSGQLSGTYTNTVNFSNATNSFSGTFSGDGNGLNSLNASQLTTGTVSDSRLQADVALLDQNQTFSAQPTFNNAVTFNGADSFTGHNTFSGPGTFSGVNTFSNNGNYFQGSFFGNGLVGWIAITGTSTTAMRDAGYLMLNASLSTLTLPATASLTTGDIVRVSGGGGGGWLVKENSGQSILGNFAAYRNSFLVILPAPLSSDDCGVAASADGVHMYIADSDNSHGFQISSDSGETWAQVNTLNGSWTSVACSADGRTIYAQPSSGFIQKSTDGGNTWAATSTSATSGFISCTSDGSTLITGNVACSGNGTYRARLSGGGIQVSSNSGGTWTGVATAPAANVFCLAASSDCTRLVAGVSNGLLYASSNMGATWTTLTTANELWVGAWMSPDGSKCAASGRAIGVFTGGVGYCNVIPQPNTATTAAGTICGSQGSAVELQYIGSSQFMPVGSTGLLWSN